MLTLMMPTLTTLMLTTLTTLTTLTLTLPTPTLLSLPPSPVPFLLGSRGAEAPRDYRGRFGGQ